MIFVVYAHRTKLTRHLEQRGSSAIEKSGNCTTVKVVYRKIVKNLNKSLLRKILHFNKILAISIQTQYNIPSMHQLCFQHFFPHKFAFFSIQESFILEMQGKYKINFLLST